MAAVPVSAAIPPQFRREFGEEMRGVFADAGMAASGAGWARQLSFGAREIAGLVCGALEEQVRSLAGWSLFPRRFAVITNRSRFRFPTAGITLMTVTLACVLFAIHNARAIAQSFTSRVYVYGGHTYYYEPDRWSFVQTFGFAFVVTVVLTVAVLAVLHTLHRSGVQRLSDAQTWPQQ